MALKKGVCKNFENCTLADNNEIQEVDSSEFRCTECGKELHEITDNGHHSAPTKTILIIVAAIILIGGGIWAYFGFIKDHQEKEEESVSLTLNKEEIPLYIGESDTLKATVSAQPSDAKASVSYMSNNENIARVDNAGVVQAISQGEAKIRVVAQIETKITDTASAIVIVDKLEKEPTPQPEPSPTPKPVQKEHVYGWYTWTGSCINGQPHGKGAMKVRQTHTIDLVDITGCKITVYPGETIIAMFDHGRLCGGDIMRKDGSSTTFSNNL